jgi:molecular chaperone HscC
VPDWETVKALAAELPQVEVDRWYGTPALKVAGKGFARLRDDGALVVMIDVLEREALMQGGAWWRAAEQAKRNLSDADSTVMSLVHQGRRIECAITRADFESASAELLQRLRRPIERALYDAKIDAAALDEVVLVGGATRMPMIRQLTTRLFQRLPLRTIDPDLAIAQGAAVQAGLKARDAALAEVVLTDVMPYSLGIVASQQVGDTMVADRFSPIIERNTPVPVSRVGVYSTVVDHQKSIRVDIRQGESPVGSENLALGVLDVDVPPRPAGAATLEVRFTYDANGLLDVDARETASGRITNTLIHNTSTQMDAAAVAAALERLKLLKRHPRDEDENRYLLERAKRLYEDRLGEERTALQAWMAQFEAALDTQDARTVRNARQQFRQALDSIDGGFRF